MERAVVVYESMFGNTRNIADAVAEGLSSRFATDIIEVGLAPTRIAEEVSLVVVGGPTHAFGLSRARTRQDAAAQADGPLISPARGLREWLETAELPRTGVGAAAFDTRIDSRVCRVPPRGAQRNSPSSRVQTRGRTRELLRVRHEGAPRPKKG
jgi:hypothetical protein